ncbi:hypothetical protein E2562_038002 [Oryza meyeriana var. granulata]|uniref:Uncharacterized protein n=1 Tax=Oryza meyeriana var. granulata TaxID=110450 RepID=A0A6G1E997_9ORYZ|nr:hypothetical protein E2562_038002 [Oryza meyeriana var. granulata]
MDGSASAELPQAHPLRGHTNCVCSIAWNPSLSEVMRLVPRREAAGYRELRLHHCDMGVLWRRLRVRCHLGGENDFSDTGHENEVRSVSWSSSGSLLTTCSRDKPVWIWEMQPGNEIECVAVLQGHTQDVKMLQWHPILDVLVSVSHDNSIRV